MSASVSKSRSVCNYIYLCIFKNACTMYNANVSMHLCLVTGICVCLCVYMRVRVSAYATSPYKNPRSASDHMVPGCI